MSMLAQQHDERLRHVDRLREEYPIVFEYERDYTEDDTITLDDIQPTIPVALEERCRMVAGLSSVAGRLRWYVGVHTIADMVLFRLAQP